MGTNAVSGAKITTRASQDAIELPGIKEMALFKRIRENQRTFSGRDVETYGYYDRDFKLTILGTHDPLHNGAQTQYIDHPGFVSREGITLFHSHPFIKDPGGFNDAYNDLPCNLVDIPSDGDIFGFLMRECAEEVIVTEHFTFKLIKTKAARMNAVNISNELTNTVKKEAMASEALDGGLLPQIFLLAYIDKYYPNTKYKELYHTYNSRTFLDICKDVFKISVIIYDTKNRIVNKDAIAGHFSYRALSAEEERDVAKSFGQIRLLYQYWGAENLSEEDKKKLNEMCE